MCSFCRRLAADTPARTSGYALSVGEGGTALDDREGEHDGREPDDDREYSMRDLPVPLPTEEEAQALADMTGDPVVAYGRKFMEPRELVDG